MHAPSKEPLDETTVEAVITRYPNKTGDILGILEELQHRHPNQYRENPGFRARRFTAW